MDISAISNFRKVFEDKFQVEPGAQQALLISQLSRLALTVVPYPLYILSGYAGTGKTTILGAYIKALDYFKIKSKLMAPTGRAAKVLSVRANKPAFTIHKMIYRLKSSGDVNSPINLAPNLSKNTVFVVDEASMIGDHSLQADGSISRNLLDDLIEYVYSAEGCKLILLGDEGQLPPVGNPNSPALDLSYMKNHYPKLKIAYYKLTEVMRQKQDSYILENATQIRNTDFIADLDLESGPDFEFIDGSQLQEKMESAYDRHGQDETMVVTRSNKNANAYNNQIRARILWYEDEICSGDMLMIVKNNYHWLNDYPEIGFIANGEMVEVTRVMRNENLYGFDFVHLNVRFVDYPLDEIELIALTETLQSETPALTRDRQKALFYAVEQDYLHEKNKQKRYELISKNPYYNAVQIKYANAITCHKAQGGQWKTVFIDQGFVPEDIQEKEYLRWLYTSITRSSEKIYMVNFPEENRNMIGKED